MVFLALGKRLVGGFQALGQKARQFAHHVGVKVKHFVDESKQWVSDITTGQFHFPGYRFMGPGTKVYERIQQGIHPTSRTDEAAMHHDLDFGEIGSKVGKVSKRELHKQVREADKRFVNRLENAGEGHHIGNFLGKSMIKAKMYLEDVGLMNPEQFLGD